MNLLPVWCFWMRICVCFISKLIQRPPFYSYLLHPDFPPFGMHQRPPGNIETDWETLGDLVRLEINLFWRWIPPAAAEPPWKQDMPCHSHTNLVSPYSKARWRGPGPLPTQTHAWPLKELLLLSWVTRNRKEKKWRSDKNCPSEFFKKLLLTQLQQILVGHTCVFLNRSRENI